MRFLIGGGGTGGHLIPGIAIYKELIGRGHSVHYVLRKDDLSYNAASLIAPEAQITVQLGRVSRSLSFKTPSQIWGIFKAWRTAFRRIKAFNPDAVLVTGGYVSNIAALSAFMLGKPLYLLEPNSAAGITNRFWAPFAKKIFTSLPEVKKIPASKIMLTGNPLLYTQKAPKKEALAFFGLGQDAPVLGISGGSQGAKALNDMLFQLLPRLGGWQLLWSLGTREYQRFVDEGKLSACEAYPNVKTFRFIDRMDYFWCAADGVLARAGAGTVSESLFFQSPALFIPIHNSPDNHQYLNAAYLCNQKMGLLLEEPNLSLDTLLEGLKNLIAQNKSLRAAFPGNTLSPAGLIANCLEGQQTSPKP